MGTPENYYDRGIRMIESSVSYGGHPDPAKKRIQTVWSLQVGDTFTTQIDGKICIYKVEGFYHHLIDGFCPSLVQVGQL